METAPASDEQKIVASKPTSSDEVREIATTESPIAKNASWGAIISITIILAMIIVGAFYSWGQHLAQQNTQAAQTQNQ